jgi:ABC-type nickel/cobalt efflux system permease component RcnA
MTPTAALAHPLGNFTINTSAALIVRADSIVVDYVVDMAEIPAFQARQRADRSGDGRVDPRESFDFRADTCRTVLGGLSLVVDGATASLAVRSTDLVFPRGQAGLRTLRLTCVASAELSTSSMHRIAFDDSNFPSRIGWREVTAAGDGTTLTRSDVPAESPSQRLTAYPKNVRPADIRSATIAFRAGGPSLRPALTSGSATLATGGLLAGLAARPDLSAGVIALMIVAAIAVGAVHALGPGHGKSLIGAYLVGSDGTLRQAAGVGGAISVMHTASVLGLGLLVLSAERALAPERVYPWLGLASGLVALGLGAALLVSRIHALSERRRHGHDHPHVHRPLSRKGLVAIAFAGGILPSPSALVVLLGSISVGRTAIGLVLIAAFSVGLAVSLVAVGAVAIRARSVANGRLPARLMRFAPVVSAGCIALVGLALTARGLLEI